MKNLLKMVEDTIRFPIVQDPKTSLTIRLITKDLSFPLSLLLMNRYREKVSLFEDGELSLEECTWTGSPKLEVEYTPYDEIKSIVRYNKYLFGFRDTFDSNGHLIPKRPDKGHPRPLTEGQAKRLARRYRLVNGPQGREALRKLAQERPR